MKYTCKISQIDQQQQLPKTHKEPKSQAWGLPLSTLNIEDFIPNPNDELRSFGPLRRAMHIAPLTQITVPPIFAMLLKLLIFKLSILQIFKSKSPSPKVLTTTQPNPTINIPNHRRYHKRHRRYQIRHRRRH